MLYKVELLGRPRAYAADAPLAAGSGIRLRSQQVWALLASLLLEGETDRRAVLADRFWPDPPSLSSSKSPDQRARKSLSMAVASLRAAFGEAAVLAEANTVSLDRRFFQTDLDALQQLRHEGTSADDPVTACVPLRAAARLFRGPFLEGCEEERGLDSWVALRRERFAVSLYAETLLALAALEEQVGNPEAAFDAVCRAVGFAPDTDPALRSLARLSTLLRRESAALSLVAHYGVGERFQELLQPSGKKTPPPLPESPPPPLLDETLMAHAGEMLPLAARELLRILAAAVPDGFTRELSRAVAPRVGEGAFLTLVRTGFVRPWTLTGNETGAADTEGIALDPPRWSLPTAVRAWADTTLTERERRRLQRRHARAMSHWLSDIFIRRADDPPGLPPEYLHTLTADREHLRQAMATFRGEPASLESVQFVRCLLHIYPNEDLDIRYAFLTAAAEAPDTSPELRYLTSYFAASCAQQGDRFSEALVWARRAFLLADGSQADSKHYRDMGNLVIGIALSAHHAANTEIAIEFADRAVRFFDDYCRAGFPWQRQFAAALYAQAEILMAVGMHPEAATACARLIDLHRNQDLGSPPRAAAWFQWGILQAIAGNTNEALHYWNDALDLFRKRKDEHGIADCLQRIGLARAHQGAIAEARYLVEDAIARYERLHKETSAAAARGVLGDILLLSGDRDAARALYESGLHFWRTHGHPRWIARFEARLGVASEAEPPRP